MSLADDGVNVFLFYFFFLLLPDFPNTRPEGPNMTRTQVCRWSGVFVSRQPPRFFGKIGSPNILIPYASMVVFPFHRAAYLDTSLAQENTRHNSWAVSAVILNHTHGRRGGEGGETDKHGNHIHGRWDTPGSLSRSDMNPIRCDKIGEGGIFF